MRKTEAARVLSCVLASLLMGCISPALAAAEQTKPFFSVGLRQIEFADGSRPLALAMFYPAEIGGGSAAPFKMPFFTKLHLYQDAQAAAGPFPLVMLSH